MNVRTGAVVNQPCRDREMEDGGEAEDLGIGAVSGRVDERPERFVRHGRFVDLEGAQCDVVQRGDVRHLPGRGKKKTPGLPEVFVTVSTQCAPEGTRTPNLLIRSQMLYPLSYGRMPSVRRAVE